MTQESLSRWLLLARWLPLIPHYIVLTLFWMAFFVVTMVAFFAILATGPISLRSFRLQSRGVGLILARGLLPLQHLGDLPVSPVHPDEKADYPRTLDIAYPRRMALMTDAYPASGLDQGGGEPAVTGGRTLAPAVGEAV